MNNVISINKIKDKKRLDQDLSKGRQPLYESHGEGDFSDRLTRIRSSLERINQLMSELKKASNTNVIKDENQSRY